MNEIWDLITGELVEMPESMKKFIEDIDSVCKKHNLSISHEDYHGKFIIEEYSEANIEWLRTADKSYTDNISVNGGKKDD